MGDENQVVVITGTPINNVLAQSGGWIVLVLLALFVVSLFSKRLREALVVPFWVALPLGVLLGAILLEWLVVGVNDLVYETFGSFEELSEDLSVLLPSSATMDDFVDGVRDWTDWIIVVGSALFLLFWMSFLSMQPGSRDDVGQDEAGVQRTVLPPARGWWARLTQYFAVRRMVLKEPGQALALARDPHFHPIGYALSRGWVAALPAVIIATVFTIYSVMRNGLAFLPEEIVQEVYTTALDILIPAMLLFLLALQSLIVTFPLNRWGASERERLETRDVYLVFGGTWGLLIQTVFVSLLAILAVANNQDSEFGRDVLEQISESIPESWSDEALAYLFGIPLGLMLLIQLYLVLIRQPWMTMAVVYPSMGAGQRAMRMLGHLMMVPLANGVLGAVFYVVVIGLAALASYAALLLLGLMGQSAI